MGAPARCGDFEKARLRVETKDSSEKGGEGIVGDREVKGLGPPCREHVYSRRKIVGVL